MSDPDDAHSRATRLIQRAGAPLRADPGMTLDARESGPRARATLTTIQVLPEVSLARAPDGPALPAAPVGLEAEFVVTATLGEGGMGRVLLAHQRSLQRDVAIKVLHDDAESAATRNAGQALLAEARASGRLEHPNIVPVHLLARDAHGQPLLVMKRIEGATWSALLDDPAHPYWPRLQPDPSARLDTHLGILTQVCHALEFAHSRGVIHRDIKPDNVMVGEYGEVYVTDWGLAVQTARAAEVDPESAGALLGTPAYMAPEMLTTDPRDVDARTDVFLLGATLHAVLTGRPRHEGGSLVEVLAHVYTVADVPYPDAIAPELARVCNRATASAPAARFADVASFRRAVAEYQTHRGSLTVCDAALERLDRFAAQVPDWDAPRASVPPDPQGALRLATECRFGLEQSLLAWPDNARARAGRGELLETLGRFCVRRGDLAGARDALNELAEHGQAPERLRRAVDELAAEDTKRRAGEERLRVIEHDQDLTLAARERGRLFGSLALLAAVVATTLLLGIFRPGRARAGRYVFVFLSPAVFAIVLTGAYVFRDKVLTNAVGRRIVGTLLIMASLVGTHRAWGIAMGRLPAQIVPGDAMISTAVTLLATWTVTRALWPLPVCFATGGALAILFPRAAVPFTAAAMVLACSLLALTLGRPGRTGTTIMPPPPPSPTSRR